MNLEKIMHQIEPPDKPHLGTVTGWILCVLMTALGFGCYFLRPTENVLGLLLMLLMSICFIFGIIILMSMTATYINMRKEYHLYLTDEHTYRHFKAMQFLIKDKENRADDELLIAYTKEHPSRKLPSWVTDAIWYRDSLTIQHYLELMAQRNHPDD